MLNPNQIGPSAVPVEGKRKEKKKEKKKNTKKIDLGWISRVLLRSVSMSSLSPFHLSQQASWDISYSLHFLHSSRVSSWRQRRRADGIKKNKFEKLDVFSSSVKGAVCSKKKKKKGGGGGEKKKRSSFEIHPRWKAQTLLSQIVNTQPWGSI